MESHIPSTSNIIASLALLTTGGTLINNRKVNNKQNKRILALEESMAKITTTVEQLQVENLKLRKLIRKQQHSSVEIAPTSLDVIQQPKRIARHVKQESLSSEEELSNEELSEDTIALLM